MINREVVEGRAKPLYIYADRRGEIVGARRPDERGADPAARLSPSQARLDGAVRLDASGSGQPMMSTPPGWSVCRPFRADGRWSQREVAHDVEIPPRLRCYPVLPLRDIVVFPHMIVPLFVGREKSVRALEDVMKEDKQILLVTQKNAAAGRSPAGGHLSRSARSAPCCSC